MQTWERQTMARAAIALVAVLFVISSVNSLDNGLAPTPPMGFLSWERFRCTTDCKVYPNDCISEKLYMDMADHLVYGGFKDVGYEYVIIDDCWLANERDAEGRLQPDPDRFPSGIKYLSDYIHDRGLKIGIYEDYGSRTCGGYPGVLGHLETDANTFAKWEVDYLKLDGCNVNVDQLDTGYPEMGRYLNKTGRPIVYSCSWPAYLVFNNINPDYAAIATACNLWRNFEDIEDDWDSVQRIMDYYSSVSDVLVANAGPGHWNDPDMLLIGNYGLSLDQSKVQMAIWAILAAPLIMSTDLRRISDEHKSILQNTDLIAVNQDTAGIQGRRIIKRGYVEVWARPILPMTENLEFSFAIAIVNRCNGGGPNLLNFTLQDMGLQNEPGYLVTDLYDGSSYGLLKPNDTLAVYVNPVGVVAVRAKVVSTRLFDQIRATRGTTTNEVR